MLRVPLNLSDYKTTVSEGKYLLVDKTKYIETLENVGNQLMFLRPRRFGKSFFLSMLGYYYDVQEKDNFDALFKDTYIYENKTDSANSFNILKFDFSGIDTNSENVKQSFYNKVKNSLDAFIVKYNLELILEDKESVVDLFDQFTSKYKLSNERHIYLMIDEYDNFANELLSKDVEMFEFITAIDSDSWLKNFFKVAKEYSGTVFNRIYVTGVTPITIDSVSSGATNIANVSRNKSLEEMLGFTEPELTNYINQLGVDTKYLPVLKEYYNNYSFIDGSNQVYNTNITLNALNTILGEGSLPEDLVDRTILTNFIKLHGLFDLMKDQDSKLEIVNQLIDANRATSNLLNTIDMSTGMTSTSLYTLLTYLGVLTIEGKEMGEYILASPNESTKTIYGEFFLFEMAKLNDFLYDENEIVKITKELIQNNNTKPLVKGLEKFINELSNRDYRFYNELTVKVMILSFFRYFKRYVMIKSEEEQNQGYADISMLPNGDFEANNYQIFELKLIKEKDFTEELFEKRKLQGLAQLEKYKQDPNFKSISNLHYWLLIVVGNKVKLIEEV
jgi:hypothetical protein